MFIAAASYLLEGSTHIEIDWWPNFNLKIDESNAMSSDQRREECVFNNKTAGEWAQLATHYSDQLDIYKPALLRFENA